MQEQAPPRSTVGDPIGAKTADPRRSPKVPINGGVLIVEDEVLVAQDIAQAFEEAGARVAGLAPSVGTALALIARSKRLHGAVLDIKLQGGVAYPVADELRRRGVPFLFATGYDASAIPARFAHVPRCEKPLDVSRIVQLLLGQPIRRASSQALRPEQGHDPQGVGGQ